MDITFAKKTTLDSLNSDISSYLSSTKYRIDVSKSVIDNSGWENMSRLPYQFYAGSAVVYNNEIHILGSGISSYYKAHYKYNGSSWTSVSTLPYNFEYASAIVYNNEIHILGSYNSSYYTAHYKFNGSSWTSVSTLPYNFYYGSAVVYNNEIHILGSYNSSYRTAHYKFDGSSWTSVSTLPYDFYYGSAVVYNNEIHILGSNNYPTYHYKWDGTSWTSISTLPCNFYLGSAVVYNNEIHILGGNDIVIDTDSELDIPAPDAFDTYYKYKDANWVKVLDLPYYPFNSGSAVLYNDEIHMLGGSGSSTAHYKLAKPFISYQLFQNMKIICDKSILTPLSSNLSEITDGYEVTTTGLVQLQSSEPISETNKPLLTILS